MEDRPWTRISAHGLCVRAGELLLVQLAPEAPDAGSWALPGGGLEWGEHPEHAVVREIAEETGLEARVVALAGLYSNSYPRTDDNPVDSLHFISLIYRVEVTGGTLRDEVDGTTVTAAWWPLGELSALPLAEFTEHALGFLEP
jgi:8-oxo-dGTP diphosphatase